MAGLNVLDVAVEAAVRVIGLVGSLPRRYAELADQATRAGGRVPLALAEGNGRRGRDRQHLWRVAYSSSLEVTATLRILRGVGAVPASEVDETLELFDRVQAMTWKLLQTHGAQPRP